MLNLSELIGHFDTGDLEFHYAINSKIQLFKKTELSGYTVSTILIDDINLLPFYQTIIMSNSMDDLTHDSINGRSYTCTLKKNAHSMHANAVAMANLAITLEDDTRRLRDKGLAKSFSKTLFFYG